MSVVSDARSFFESIIRNRNSRSRENIRQFDKVVKCFMKTLRKYTRKVIQDIVIIYCNSKNGHNYGVRVRVC